VTDDMYQSGILVGYDGSRHSTRALDWAIQEARRHDVPLVICTVVPDSTPDPRLYGTRWPPVPDLSAAAEQLLAEAQARVTAAAPGVSVTGAALLGAPGRSLVNRADRAELVVVGSRGRGGVASMLLGSVSLYVAAHAPCPVVVVPAGDQSRPDAAGGRVVVGYDGSAPADAALAFAVAEAVVRGAELAVVQSAQQRRPPGGPPVFDSETMSGHDASARGLLLQAIEPWAAKHPNLTISPIFTTEPPAAFLVDQSATAELLVVGSHGNDPFTGTLLGSVSHAAVHAARCPVAVIRAHT
jgi:nucleotide-binding universal stress UspA family protein